jgi:hypothetical protein
MSNLANELLDNLSEDELAALSVDQETEEHIVIGSDRFITVPESLKRIAVQYDHNVETVTFDCPRYWDGLDMSQLVIYVNVMCPDNTLGGYLMKNVRVDAEDETIMHFDWTITRNITKAKGNLKFLVCIKTTDADGNEENHWNSELNSDMYISAGLECSETVIDKYPDIITQLLESMGRSEAAVAAGAGIKSIEQTFESTEANGENTIKITLTDGREPMYFTVRNGLTPIRGTDYWTEKDKQEIIDSVLASYPKAEDYEI